MPIGAGIKLIDAPLFGTGKEPVKSMEETVGPENFARIQRNMVRLTNAGADPFAIDNYLTRVEGLPSSIDPKFADVGMNPITIRSLSEEGARHVTSGISLLGAIPTLGVDVVDTATRQAGKLLTLQWDEIPKFNPRLTQVQQRGAEMIEEQLFGEAPDPEKQHFAERALGQIAEFVVPGALITKAFTTQGARLAMANPAELGYFKKMFVASASSGEAAVTLASGGGAGTNLEDAEWFRLGAELGAIVPAMLVQRLTGSLKNLAKRKLTLGPEHVKRAAELEVGKYFSMLMEMDPNSMRSIQEGRRIMQKTGVDLSTQELLQNPNLQATLELLQGTGDTVATTMLARLQAATKRTNKFVTDVAPILNPRTGKNIQPPLRKFLSRELDAIDKRYEKILRDSADEIETLRPTRSEREIGESALIQLEELKDEALKKAEHMYDQLDNNTQYSVKQIQAGMKKAELGRTARKTEIKDLEAGRQPTPPLEQPNDSLLQAALDTAERNFGGDIKKTSLLRMREFRQSLNQLISQARKNGNDDVVERLGQMKRGVDRQLSVARGANTGVARQTFKEANRFYKGVNDRFERSFAAMMTQKDMMGVNTFHPEDFSKHWIRPSTRKSSIQVAKDFKKAFGDTPRARALIEDSVSGELNKVLDDAGGAADLPTLRKIESYLIKRKDSLKAHGVWDKFNTSEKALARAKQGSVSRLLSKKQFEEEEFMQVIGLTKADDVLGFLQRKMQAGRLGELRKQIGVTAKDQMDSPQLRGYKRLVWDMVVAQSETGTRFGDDLISRQPDKLLDTVLTHKDDLVGALGKDHVENLEVLGRLYKRQFGRGGVETIKKAAADELGRVSGINQRQIGRAFSKIRASLQGFVSPQFTALQLANQAFDIINSGVAHRVLESALTDPDMALTLARLANEQAGRQMLRAIGVAAIPSTARGMAAVEDPTMDED
jgi:hypothetical protein